MPDITMQDAIDAGDGTLHGAIDHWQNRCAELEEKLKVAEEAIRHYESALGIAFPTGAKGLAFGHWNAARIAIAKIKEAS